MGGCISEQDPEMREGMEKNKKLDVWLRHNNQDYKTEVKLLLLGSGDSGKSTFLRQIKHLHGVDSGLESEKAKFTSVIKHNCLKSFKDFCNGVLQKELPIPPKLEEKVQFILEADELNSDVASAILKVWGKEKSKMRKYYDKIEVTIQIPTNSPYFWEISKTVANPEYEPTKDDIIQAKIRTIGIQDTHFVFDDTKFLIVDVGGQRSERRKWLHCFNNINAVIFLTAIDEYDGKVLEEDNHTNRMLDSLSLFEKLSESSWFDNIPFILFLNKIDLFEKKLDRVPLDTHFDDFDEIIEDAKNDPHVRDALSTKKEQSVYYIKKLFMIRYKGKGNIFTFETNATDEKACDRVFKSIRLDIISKKLQSFI